MIAHLERTQNTEIQKHFGLSIEKIQTKAMSVIDIYKRLSEEELTELSENDKIILIQQIQNALFVKCDEAQKKQSRVDELLRENAKYKTKIKDMKCPLCLNGERIPP